MASLRKATVVGRPPTPTGSAEQIIDFINQFNIEIAITAGDPPQTIHVVLFKLFADSFAEENLFADPLSGKDSVSFFSLVEKFLKAEFSLENLGFLQKSMALAIQCKRLDDEKSMQEALKVSPTHHVDFGLKKYQAALEKFYQTYIPMASTESINIPYKTRIDIESAHQNAFEQKQEMDIGTFIPAIHHICSLIQKDTFSRLIKDPEIIKALNKIRDKLEHKLKHLIEPIMGHEDFYNALKPLIIKAYDEIYDSRKIQDARSKEAENSAYLRCLALVNAIIECRAVEELRREEYLLVEWLNTKALELCKEHQANPGTLEVGLFKLLTAADFILKTNTGKQKDKDHQEAKVEHSSMLAQKIGTCIHEEFYKAMPNYETIKQEKTDPKILKDMITEMNKKGDESPTISEEELARMSGTYSRSSSRSHSRSRSSSHFQFSGQPEDAAPKDPKKPTHRRHVPIPIPTKKNG